MTNPWEPAGIHRDFEPATVTREMRRRERLQRRMARGRVGRLWQGFGCLFAVVFLVVMGSLVTATATLLAHFGPVPMVIAAAAVALVVTASLRGLAGASRDLDDLLEATRRVRAGDYGVRLGRTRSDFRPMKELGRGFDTMARRLEVDEAQRRTLLADVSHELRTPLAVITANLEGIVDGIYPADAAHVASILDETRTMERLIEDLRTLALSDAGTLQLHPESIDPDALVRETVRSFEVAAAAGDITLRAVVDRAASAVLEGDPVRLREVLANLVSNALRHTPPGGSVTVSTAAAAGGERIAFEVRDTGPGIPPELLPHVFDRFVKGEGSHGSGLGLAIARSLVQAHGGTISVESARNGTAFHVELPAADPDGE